MLSAERERIPSIGMSDSLQQGYTNVNLVAKPENNSIVFSTTLGS